ncbi:porin [Rhizobacter sp. P5_C2]
MKKSLLVLAALGAFAGAASAQSSVTLFGIVDVNARYTKNGDSKIKSLSTDGLNSSRLGFRGVEDLGGGLKAGFWLETSFAADSGNGGTTSNGTNRFWHRRSTVSLLGNFGEIRAGRELTATYTGFADYDVMGTNGVGDVGHFNAPSTVGATLVDTATRSDNMVSYYTPALGGFYARASVAAGEGTPGKKHVAGRVGYAAGPLDVSGSYGTTDANAAEDKYKKGNVGASYDFGVVKVMGFVSQAKFLDAKQNVVQAGVSVPFGPTTLRANYVRVDAKGKIGATSIDADDANQFSLGAIYDLSKRTALYTSYAQIKNKGAAKFAVAGGSATSLPNIAAGQKSQGFEAGIRHSF